MEADYWHDRWSLGQIGFHQQDINAFLRAHWSALNLNGQGEVLVPLCGKSLDMLWLKQQGHSVIGAELSQQALDDFLKENGLEAVPIVHDAFCGYELPDMKLFCGDFFHLNTQDCESAVAVYDRAALVAFPPEMRKQYVEHLRKILPAQAKILLITMVYDQSLNVGPPFTVTDEEVHSLYQDHFNVEPVQSKVIPWKGIETTYVITPK